MHNIDNDIIHINENVNHISDIFDPLEIMTIFLRKREIFVFVRGAIVFSIYTFLCGDTDHLHLPVPAENMFYCGYEYMEYMDIVTVLWTIDLRLEFPPSPIAGCLLGKNK